MATKVKITHKELKKPDKFLEFIDRSTNYLADNYKKIIYFISALIAVIIIFFLINSYSEKRSADANNIYNEAIAAKNSGDYETALERFGLLQKDYGSQNVSNLSLYYTASIYYDKNNYDQAINFAQIFISKSPQDLHMADAANLLIANSYLNKNEYQQVIEYSSKISNPQSPYANNAELTKGLALHKLGRHDEAAQIYNKILANMYPNTFQTQ